MITSVNCEVVLRPPKSPVRTWCRVSFRPATSLGAKIVAAYLSFRDGVENGLLDLVRVLVKAHVLQHHDAAQEECRRVREALACYVGRGTVHALVDGAFGANVAGHCQCREQDVVGRH